MEGIQRCSERLKRTLKKQAKGKQQKGLVLKEINMLYSRGAVHIYQYKSGCIWLQRIWIPAPEQAPVLSFNLVTKNRNIQFSRGICHKIKTERGKYCSLISNKSCLLSFPIWRAAFCLFCYICWQLMFDKKENFVHHLFFSSAPLTDTSQTSVHCQNGVQILRIPFCWLVIQTDVVWTALSSSSWDSGSTTMQF